MKEKLYKKEIWITVIFTILLLLMGHTATVIRLFFPADASLPQATLWGFPIHYTIPLITGWFGLMALCAVQAYVCNKFDDELDAYAEGNKKS